MKREPAAVKALITKHQQPKPPPYAGRHRAEDRTPLDDRNPRPDLQSRVRP
jgi:hypothetical protein